MIKKIWRATLILTFVLSVGLAPLFASPVYAQQSDAGKSMLDFLNATAEKGGLNVIDPGKGEITVLNVIGNVVNIILGLVGIIFFILMFYSGIRWMTSQGNEEVVKEAKATIKTAAIGIVVVFSSFVITNFVLNQIDNINKNPTEENPTELPAAGP
jgi:hypothetical protein